MSANTLLAIRDHGSTEADELDQEAAQHLAAAIDKAKRAALIRLAAQIASVNGETV